MIEISEQFTVAAPPAATYAVLSDPHAVVECISGAALGEQHDDGSYDTTMTVRFSALRVQFKGQVALELDAGSLAGTVTARGRDGQGGTKFTARAGFAVTPGDGGTTASVQVTGEVQLSGKLASVIDNAAAAVVRRMTAEFVEALGLRCVSEPTEIGPAEPEDRDAGAASATPAVLLLHGFGTGPGDLRAWGEALARTGATVSIPCLPGHGSQWRDLDAVAVARTQQVVAGILDDLRSRHPVVLVMGLSFGATLALQAAAQQPDVAGVVAVNPAITGLRFPSPLRSALSFLAPSVRVRRGGVTKPGVRAAGYDRLAIGAIRALRELGRTTAAQLGSVAAPVLLVTSPADEIVSPGDSEVVARGLSRATVSRLQAASSSHHVPIDNDAPLLYERSAQFVAAVAGADWSPSVTG